VAYNPLTEARAVTMAALEAAIPDVTCYGAPPEVLTPPGVIITPGDPWLQARTWTSSQVTLELALVAPVLGSNEAAYERLEELAWAVQVALTGIAVLGPLASPTLQTFGQVQAAMASQTILLTLSDEETP
jgi:hypothetical protein